MPVEEPALGSATRLLMDLRRHHHGVRWVRTEGLHLTLHYFGSVPRAQLGSLLAPARPAAAATVPFDLTLEGLGRFPERGAPRVLWLGAGRGAAQLGALAARCRAALVDAGAPGDSRPFSPHCTLGRPASRWTADEGAAWTSTEPRLPPFRARRVVLFESVPGGDGTVYAPLAEVSLGDPTMVAG